MCALPAPPDTRTVKRFGWISARCLLVVAVATCVRVGQPDAKADAAPSRDLGVYIPWSTDYLTQLDSFTQLVGGAPKIVMWYSDWTKPLVTASRLDTIRARGAVSQITWEPWNDSQDANQPAYALKNIVAGDFDAYIDQSARDAAAYQQPFQIRFAHEMNGTWTSWGRGVNTNTSSDYVAAWRRVVSIFRARGATNVEWVWTPNVDPLPFSDLYPGDDWVDWVGLDGYNWGSLDRWQSFTDVFSSAYDSLASLTSKRMIIGETGSNESGGDKAGWIRSGFLTEIPDRFPRIQAVIWFNKNQQTDWRIQSSATSLAAYRDVVASPLFGGSSVPTAVKLVSFKALKSRKGVRVSWRTGSAIGALGSNVWRSTKAGGPYKKLNRAVVATKEQTAPASYSYVDRAAARGRTYFYKLQLIAIDGPAVWAGPTRAR